MPFLGQPYHKNNSSILQVKNFCDKQFTTVTTHKYVQNYCREKNTYNVNTHWNLLYALKTWNC